MSFSVFSIQPFDRQIKKLAKKYPSLKTEFTELIENLEIKPNQGTALINNCYKIRISIKSKGKGKRGGARVITHIHVTREKVFLLAIYDKSEKESMTNKELKELLGYIE